MKKPVQRKGVQLALLASAAALALVFIGVAQGAAPPDPNTVGATTLSGIELNGVTQTTITVAGGTHVTISANWSDGNSGCPNCIDFVDVAYSGQAAAAGCIENPGQYSGAIRPNSGSGSVDLGPAPTTPGTYDVIGQFEEQFNCGDGWNSAPPPYTVIAQVTVPKTNSQTSTTVQLNGVDVTSVPIGSQVTDHAVVTPAGATGTVTFSIYTNGNCSGQPVFSQGPYTLAANGTVSSGPLTLNSAITFAYLATYSGDGNYNGSTGPCEPVTVVQKTNTQTSTTVQLNGIDVTSVPVGSQVTDHAVVAPSGATGTVTFAFYANGSCIVPSTSTSTTTVSGGAASSNPVGPLAAGAYSFTAVYNGDSNYNGSTGSCEPFTVTKASPSLSTSASAGVSSGGSVYDTATVSGGYNPTGSITFKLYGPLDPTCIGTAVFSGNATVSGNGSYNSPSFTAITPGTYHWAASYPGDSNNNSVSVACGASNESVTVVKATPSFGTTASGPVVVGSAIHDTATLSGGSSPTGTITFGVYGAGDPNCTNGALAVSTVTVSGNGSYNSANFHPLLPGLYRWIASYSGDANNNAASSGCNVNNESVVVGTTRATTTLSTQATPTSQLYTGPMNDTATLGGGTNPTGSITFKLYNMNDPTCSGTPVFTQTVSVSGDGVYVSGTYVPMNTGTYQWVASYSGDNENNGVTGACGAANESTTVGPLLGGLVAPTVAPSLFTPPSGGTPAPPTGGTPPPSNGGGTPPILL